MQLTPRGEFMEMSMEIRHYNWPNLGFISPTKFVNRWSGVQVPQPASIFINQLYRLGMLFGRDQRIFAGLCRICAVDSDIAGIDDESLRRGARYAAPCAHRRSGAPIAAPSVPIPLSRPSSSRTSTDDLRLGHRRSGWLRQIRKS